jgi:hypothetical protein
MSLVVLTRMNTKKSADEQGTGTNNTNSMFIVRQQTIPTERPLIGEVSANFSG